LAENVRSKSSSLIKYSSEAAKIAALEPEDERFSGAQPVASRNLESIVASLVRKVSALIAISRAASGEYCAGIFFISNCWSLIGVFARNCFPALRLSYGFSAQIGAINKGGST
jgi:hypothetical protein